MKIKAKTIAIIAGAAAAAGILYYLLTRQQAAPPAAASQQQGISVGIPSFTGTPSSDPTGYLLGLAAQQCGLTGDSVVVRILRPEDLGLTTSFGFTSTALNTWENWVSSTVADCTFVAILGVSYSGTSFSQVRVQGGSSYVGYANLGFVSGLESQVYYFQQPIIVEQNQPIIIDVISRAIAGPEYVNLMGIVVEKRGMTINP
jgi:hypothetical protein